jgi:hypothetical protein
VDTTERQELLRYQRRDLDDYTKEMVALLGYRRHLIRMFRPIVRYWPLRKSPYFAREKAKWAKHKPAARSVSR